MSSCEKCWRDAGGDATRYAELLRSRQDHPCTPEEQAGPARSGCRVCKRNAVHQHTGECMACRAKRARKIGAPPHPLFSDAFDPAPSNPAPTTRLTWAELVAHSRRHSGITMPPAPWWRRLWWRLQRRREIARETRIKGGR